MIGLYAFKRASNEVLQIDDPSVTTDEGSAMETPFVLTAPLDLGPAGGTARMRRIAQAVAISNAATVTVTPVVNGSEDTSQAEAVALVTADGPEQIVESYPAVTGGRFQVKVEVTSFDGDCAIGEADVALVPKRSTVRV